MFGSMYHFGPPVTPPECCCSRCALEAEGEDMSDLELEERGEEAVGEGEGSENEGEEWLGDERPRHASDAEGMDIDGIDDEKFEDHRDATSTSSETRPASRRDSALGDNSALAAPRNSDVDDATPARAQELDGDMPAMQVPAQSDQCGLAHDREGEEGVQVPGRREVLVSETASPSPSPLSPRQTYDHDGSDHSDRDRDWDTGSDKANRYADRDRDSDSKPTTPSGMDGGDPTPVSRADAENAPREDDEQPQHSPPRARATVPEGAVGSGNGISLTDDERNEDEEDDEEDDGEDDEGHPVATTSDIEEEERPVPAPSRSRRRGLWTRSPSEDTDDGDDNSDDNGDAWDGGFSSRASLAPKASCSSSISDVPDMASPAVGSILEEDEDVDGYWDDDMRGRSEHESEGEDHADADLDHDDWDRSTHSEDFTDSASDRDASIDPPRSDTEGNADSLSGQLTDTDTSDSDSCDSGLARRLEALVTPGKADKCKRKDKNKDKEKERQKEEKRRALWESLERDAERDSDSSSAVYDDDGNVFPKHLLDAEKTPSNSEDSDEYKDSGEDSGDKELSGKEHTSSPHESEPELFPGPAEITPEVSRQSSPSPPPKRRRMRSPSPPKPSPPASLPSPEPSREPSPPGSSTIRDSSSLRDISTVRDTPSLADALNDPLRPESSQRGSSQTASYPHITVRPRPDDKAPRPLSNPERAEILHIVLGNIQKGDEVKPVGHIAKLYPKLNTLPKIAAVVGENEDEVLLAAERFMFHAAGIAQAGGTLNDGDLTRLAPRSQAVLLRLLLGTHEPALSPATHLERLYGNMKWPALATWVGADNFEAVRGWVGKMRHSLPETVARGGHLRL